jgi:hypothetical protein
VRRHHTGSGRSTTTVIPDDWQDHHAGVVAQTFKATITIGNPEAATGTFNDTTGTTDVTPAAAIYSGPAAIAVVTDTDRLVAAADEQASTRMYEVSLPVDVAGIKPNHVVHVDDSPDPMLTGRDLAIDTAQLGDRRFSRVLHAILND